MGGVGGARLCREALVGPEGAFGVFPLRMEKQVGCMGAISDLTATLENLLLYGI